MPKQKERSSDEYYRGVIRELKKEVKQLRQLLRQYEKYEQTQDEAEVSKDSEDTMPKKVDPPCPDCAKGKLRYFELIGRTYCECNVCSYRKKISG